MFCWCVLSSQVGQQILSQCNLDNVEEGRDIISAVIGTRSSTTAISRANSILRYLRWSDGHDDMLDPQTENSLHAGSQEGRPVSRCLNGRKWFEG